MSAKPGAANAGFWHWLWQQHWLPAGLRKIAYKKLNALDQAPDAPFDVDFFGLRYCGNLSNGIEFAIYYYGAFEKPLLFFLRDALLALQESRPQARHCSVFLDVGANIGQHSLFMSQVADQVHAFEPYAAVANRLRKHLALNNIDNIVLHEIGLGDSNGRLPFFAPASTNKGVGSFNSESQRYGNTPVGELIIRRTDDYLPEQGIEHVDLVKIDVEGFERQTLLGMSQTLSENRPVIVCEVSYGQQFSFTSKEDLLSCLPDNYRLLQFNTRKANGDTARRRGSRAKRSGAYQLLPVTEWRDQDQDDLIAIPAELINRIPHRNT